jgi:hypothetical protein
MDQVIFAQPGGQAFGLFAEDTLSGTKAGAPRLSGTLFPVP